MDTATVSSSAFTKVGPCLYRYIPSGVYYARVKSAGKEIRRSLGTSDRKYADRKLRQLRDDLDRLNHDLASTTVVELVEKYLGTRCSKSSKTQKDDKTAANAFKSAWSKDEEKKRDLNQRVSSVVPSQIMACMAVMGTSKGRKADSLSGTTMQKRFQFVRAVFNLAVLDRIITTNPCAELKPPKREKIARPTPTWEEFKTIITAIRSQIFNADAEESAAYVEFIGLAGLGNAEVNALTWSDVKFEEKKIQVIRAKTKTAFPIHIYPQLLPFLENLRARREATGSFIPEAKLFPIRDAKKALKGACQRLGLPAYSHRAIRRCFITRAVELGIDFKTIAGWQGHQDGGVLIAKIYSELRNKHSDDMATRMVD
jgi:integrase